MGDDATMSAANTPRGEVAAVDQGVMNHDGPWTEEAYLALRHDGRAEVVDGTLLIGPRAGKQRLEVIERVRATIDAALPNGLRVIGPVPLRLGPDCVLMPDLVVTADVPDADEDKAEDTDADSADDTDADADTDSAADSADDDEDEVMEASAALMIVEVIGCDHGAADRSFKPQLYARSRIPYSVLIDHDAPFALAEMIIGGRYHEYAYAGEGAALLLEEPFPLELDLAKITDGRAESAADAG
jgi:hypothetical protein